MNALLFAVAVCMNMTALAQQKGDTLALDSMDYTELAEVVVAGHLPHTKMEGNALVTRVQGSPLEKAGTASDVLRKVPGMISKGQDLEVIGRGTPIYYVNGRRVRDLDELKRIMSDEMASVEVITNPGAAYDATVTAVVRIKTVRKQGDGFSFGVFGKTEQSLRTAENDPEGQVDVNYRHRGWDVFAGVKEWKYTSRQWSDMGQYTTGSYPHTQEGNFENKWQGVGTHSNVGFNWQVNDRHSLGARLDYNVRQRTDQSELLRERMWSGDVLTDDLESRGSMWSKRPANYLLNTYYNGNAGKLNIDFNADVYINDDNVHQETVEKSEMKGDEIVDPFSKNHSRMIAGKLVFSYPIWKGQLQVGTEETFVNRDDKYIINSTVLPSTHADVCDYTYAAFAQYMFSLNRVGQLMVGLRYEHAYFDYKSDVESANLQRKYDNVFPSATFSTRVGKSQMSLSYSAKTSRPSFYQLDGSMSYHSRYVLQQGNPKLKPATQQSLSWMSMYRFMTFGTNYDHTKDVACNWSSQYNDEGAVLVSFKNMEKPLNQVSLFASATKTWGCFTPSWTAAYVQQWLTLDFDNGSRSFNKPMFVFNANNTFQLKHSWQLELNSAFHSKANFNNVELTNNFWQLDAVVQKSFLKNDALTLRLLWQDIFRMTNQDVFAYYGAYTIRQTNAMDNNRVCFSVRYNFNTARSKYKGSGAGSDARSRIGNGNK